MTRITENRKDKVTFEKETREEKWFGDGDCSYEKVKKLLNRENDTIITHEFHDDKYIGSKIIYFFKTN